MKSKPPRKSLTVAPSAASDPGKSAAPWWLHAAVVIGLLAANLTLYSRTVPLGFLSVDDPDYIQNNPWLEGFRASNLKHIFTEPYFANYAPVTILSYLLDIALAGGKDAAAIHLSNVMWHGWVVCMVYLLAFTLRAEIVTATAATLLFLLHPTHVEVVAWISSRKDLIATGFAALSMTCYLLYLRAARPEESVQSRSRACWYSASLLCFLLASAGKQSVLLLPAVMLAWDILVERRRGWPMLADKVAFGLITIFFGWMTWSAQPSTNQAWHPFTVAATELANLWLLTGFGQYTLYRSAPNASSWSQAARFAIMLAALLVWVLPLVLLKWAWFRGVTQPRGMEDAPAQRPMPAAIGAVLRPGTGALRTSFVALCYWVLIQMVPPMPLNFMVPITDRYLFLSSVGLCILLVHTAARVAAHWPRLRWVGSAAVLGLALVWGLKTSSYIDEWRDPRSVWYGAHVKTKSSQVQQFLGEVYHNAGERVDNYIKSGVRLNLTNDLPLAQAVLQDPGQSEQLKAEWLGTTPARTNSIAYRDRLWNFAWERYEESVARRGTLSAPNLFMNRGRLLVSQGKAEAAILEFQKALAFAQTSSYELIRHEMATHALYAIGVAYWNLRNYTEAQKWLLQAQEAQRKSGRAWIPALDKEVERIQTLAAGRR